MLPVQTATAYGLSQTLVFGRMASRWVEALPCCQADGKETVRKCVSHLRCTFHSSQCSRHPPHWANRRSLDGKTCHVLGITVVLITLGHQARQKGLMGSLPLKSLNLLKLLDCPGLRYCLWSCRLLPGPPSGNTDSLYTRLSQQTDAYRCTPSVDPLLYRASMTSYC